MTFVAGSDHAGFAMRKQIARWLKENGHRVIEVGAESEDRYDYPDASDAVCCALLRGEAERGILICGTGIGVSIRANRYPGIRAALCTAEAMAKLAIEHNHANVLCLGGRMLAMERAIDIVTAFISAAEDHDQRHQVRVEKLDASHAC